MALWLYPREKCRYKSPFINKLLKKYKSPFLGTRQHNMLLELLSESNRLLWVLCQSQSKGPLCATNMALIRHIYHDVLAKSAFSIMNGGTQRQHCCWLAFYQNRKTKHFLILMQILAVSTAVHYFSSIFHQTDLGEKVFSNEKKKNLTVYSTIDTLTFLSK